MNSWIKKISLGAKVGLLGTVIAFSTSSLGSQTSFVIDDFNDDNKTPAGFSRMSMTDAMAGGKTAAELSVVEGVMYVKGDIEPPRGQPGWASTVLPLNDMGKALDASKYQGIKLMVKLDKGNLNLSANSTQVTNFDYHASPVVVKNDGKFHEITIPFESMKRGWSEQTELDSSTLNSLSIVAYGMQKSSFAFAIDSVSFY